jgi:DMSO/TMAO reductase YedYZ heme-binding membrane subunit
LRARRPYQARPAAGPGRPRGRHWALIAIVLAGSGWAAAAASHTAQGRGILAALQRFLLFYSGVFALVALTAVVAAGLIATDRLVMTPVGRVISQAVHRALALAAVGFLGTHILLEILAHRSRAIDAVVPFLAGGRTLYLGLGTLASDLVLLIVVTSIARRRFAIHRPGAWRALHATAYLAWPLAIVHGLLGGRPAKPYVDWSYGACLALVALALVIRLAATRGRTDVAAGAVPGRAEPGAWRPVPPAPHGAWPGEFTRGPVRRSIERGGMPRAGGGR